jgi:hypothetical protein
MAKGCLTGPPAYVTWRASTTTLCQSRLYRSSRGLRIGPLASARNVYSGFFLHFANIYPNTLVRSSPYFPLYSKERQVRLQSFVFLTNFCKIRTYTWNFPVYRNCSRESYRETQVQNTWTPEKTEILLFDLQFFPYESCGRRIIPIPMQVFISCGVLQKTPCAMHNTHTVHCTYIQRPNS